MNNLRKNFPKQFLSTLTKLCTENSNVFALEVKPITTNNFYGQRLRVKDKQPVHIKNYRMPQLHKEKKLMDDNIIEPLFSEYNNPNLLVPKKSLPGSDKKR